MSAAHLSCDVAVVGAGPAGLAAARAAAEAGPRIGPLKVLMRLYLP